MSRYVAAAIAFVLAAVSVATPAAAQNRPFYFLGAGATLPTGEYGDYAKTGWMVDGGAGMPVGTDGRLWFGADAMYGSNKHDDDTGDKTNLYGAFGNVGYQFMQAAPSPYIYGAAGLLVHHYSPGDSGFDSESETKFAWGGGAGYVIPIGSASLWAEARYVARADTKFIPIMVGVTIGGS